MINITQEFYKDLYKRLMIDIGESNYYSSKTLSGTTDDFDYTLVISAVIYRDDFGSITEIVPVWWEFHTEIDGVEKMNDFFFSEIQKLV